MNKRVLIKSFSGLAVDPNYTVGWEDIYLELHWPKRHKLYLAPTFMTRDDLVHDIKIQFQLAEENKKKEWAIKCEEHGKFLQGVLEQLDRDGMAVDAKLDCKALARSKSGDRNQFALSGVYTAKEWINRAEAERMITYYLGLFGVKDAKYTWIRPSFFCHPVSVRG